MQIALHVPAAGSELARAIERRVQAGLERYQSLVRQTSIWIKDENGPRGGRDQACLVRVELVGGGELVVRELREQPLQAVGRAVKRLRRQLSDQINRRPQQRRRHSTARRAAADTLDNE